MRKIGVIWTGHPDYLCENTTAIQKAIHESIQGIPGVDSRLEPIAVTEKQAVAAAREVLQERDCCGALIVLTTWVECNVVMAAMKEFREMPILFWGFPLEECEGRKESTGSYVSATMFAGVVKRVGLPYPTLYTSWKNPKTLEQIERFAKVAGVMDELFYTKIGLFGYTSMSIYTGTFDHVLLRYILGPEVEQMDQYSLIHAAEAVPEEEIKAAEEKLGACACIRGDVDPEVLKKTMALYVALKNFCKEKDWKAVNVKCQYELSIEYKAIPCVAISLLAEDGINTSCEGDMMNTVSMLLLQLLTDEVVWYGDSLTEWDNVVQFSPCGFMPPSLAHGTASVQPFPKCDNFAGLHVCGVLRPERVTFMRIVEDVGDYHILYGTGQGIETEPRGGCQPALNVVLDGNLENLREEYAGQHFALCYGDLSEEIELFARLMNLEARRV